MTRDQIQSVHDDIAYMKALAQEGSRAPLLGGAILIAAGLTFGVASLIHYGVESGVVDLPPVAYPVIWVGALLVFFATLMVQNARIRRKPGAQSAGNRASGAGWMGVGLGIFVMSLSIAVVSWKVQSEIPTLIFPSLIFALYGSGWAVSATMSGQAWQWRFAVGCCSSAARCCGWPMRRGCSCLRSCLACSWCARNPRRWCEHGWGGRRLRHRTHR
jgi:hypothetical protein